MNTSLQLMHYKKSNLLGMASDITYCVAAAKAISSDADDLWSDTSAYFFVARREHTLARQSQVRNVFSHMQVPSQSWRLSPDPAIG